MRSHQEKVLILGSVLLIGIFAAAMPFMLRIPSAARFFVVQAHTKCEPFVVDLIAGGGNRKSEIVVGCVAVWNDDCYLYVRYRTTGGWCLTETHLHVATSLEGIPQKNGNPIPGHFDYKKGHGCVTEYTYRIRLTWDEDTRLYIGAHAVVLNRCACRSETAWARGRCGDFGFPGKNWATYFTYTVQ